MDSVVNSWQRVFIEITNRCNFDCNFCPSGISVRPKRDMPYNTVLRLIDELQSMGFQKTIYFHVLGEPLLHPQVFDIVNHAAGAGLNPVIFTNGGALTPEIVSGTLSSRTAEVVISMQTINQQAYESLRTTPIGWDDYLKRIQTTLAIADDRVQPVP